MPPSAARLTESPKAFRTLEGRTASTASMLSPTEHAGGECPSAGPEGPGVGRVEGCLPALGLREQVKHTLAGSGCL